ncbi:uncharacterized protein LOC131886784 [Tigriopus californicus]|uniref:uncharacterized protein LOC131886784 n=1 Tax=Tigriopus californicus TaxID=6832 RepID=UPI0027DAB0E0|nr:uncharacterized protein LOC131886784 [Tigriopus californicus]
MTWIHLIVAWSAILLLLAVNPVSPSPPQDLNKLSPPNPTDAVLDSFREFLHQIMAQRDHLVLQAAEWIKAVLTEALIRMGLIRPPVEEKIDRRDDIILPVLGGALRYEDVFFLERIILDTVDVVRSWQRRYAHRETVEKAEEASKS